MTGGNPVDAAAADWLARQDRGPWSPADQAALEQWLDRSTANRTAYLRLTAVWAGVDRLAELAADAPRRRWPIRIPVPALAALAACLLTILAGTVWLLRPVAEAVHATPLGGYAEVRLRDGSQVALNTDTRLQAAVDRGRREVWLDRGEAYFEVAHDRAHPFVVHAGRQRITVLGTRFSVRMDDGRLKVAVTDGRVRIDADAPATAGGPILLARGEVAIATDRGLLVATETPEQLKDGLAWRQGWVVFDKVTLADAAAEFNRYSARKLVVADPGAGAIRIGGRFATDNVEGFARLMQTGMGLEVDYRPDSIVISK